MLLDYDWTEQRGSGKPKLNFAGEPIPRPKQVPPPCSKCPKRSPAKEHEHVLSRKNWLTYQIALQVHATGGRCITETMAQDGLLMENVSIVCRILESYQRHDLAEQIAIHTYGMGRK